VAAAGGSGGLGCSSEDDAIGDGGSGGGRDLEIPARLRNRGEVAVGAVRREGRNGCSFRSAAVRLPGDGVGSKAKQGRSLLARVRWLPVLGVSVAFPCRRGLLPVTETPVLGPRVGGRFREPWTRCA
jgi:hypothetical protein